MCRPLLEGDCVLGAAPRDFLSSDAYAAAQLPSYGTSFASFTQRSGCKRSGRYRTAAQASLMSR